MRNVDWDAVQENDGTFDNPVPGGYVAKICRVEDVEDREYLLIEWDFSEGAFKGFNEDTFSRAGFWPTRLFRSYKPKALGFFKAFKTALEESNPGYHFREDELNALVGKRFGVVLAEEEYIKSNGARATRLYVAQTRSLRAIKEGDYTVPDKKLLPSDQRDTHRATDPVPVSATGFDEGGFAEVEDDGELPF